MAIFNKTLINSLSNNECSTLELNRIATEEGSYRLDGELAEGQGSSKLMMLLLPTDCSLSTWVTVSNSSAKEISKIEFLAEESFPADLEDLALDAWQGEEGALVIASELAPLRKLIDRLEEEKREVAWVIPNAILSLQSIASELDQDTDCILMEDQQGVSAFWMEKGVVRAWEYLRNDVSTCLDFMGHYSKNSEMPSALLVGMREDVANEIVLELASRSIDVKTESKEWLASKRQGTIEAIASGRAYPFINLRQGRLSGAESSSPLIQGWINIAIAASLLGMLGLGIAMWGRVMLDRTELAKLEEREVKLYRQVFPKGKIPGGIRKALASELGQMQELEKNIASSPKVPRAAWVWLHTMHALPQDGTFRVQSMVLADQRILSLNGVAEKVEDLDGLMKGLRAGGFEFQVPGINNMGSGFQAQLKDVTIPTDRLAKEFVNHEAEKGTP